jgi:hypothetical protein
MTIEEVTTLEVKAANYLGCTIPLREVGIQSNENAVFSQVSKGFGTEDHASGKKGLDNFSSSAKLITGSGQLLYVSLNKLVDYFENNE